MKQIDYELLNKRLEHFLFDEVPVFEDDFIFEERLCNIMLDNKLCVNFNIPKEKLYKTKNNISLEKSILLNIDFFKKIDKKYSIQLEELLENDKIEFKITNDIDEKSYIDISNGDIKISLLKRVEDILSLGHEFMHYLNSRRELATPITSFYTECFSNYCELLLIDYIVEEAPLYKSDIFKMKRNIFIALYEINICTKILIEMMKKKINGIDINLFELSDIVRNIYQKGIDLNLIDTCLSEILTSILTENEEEVEDEYVLLTRNTICLPIACYMYEIFSSKKNIKEIFELGDKLHTLELVDFLLYLDLEFKEKFFDLTEESYEKIEKSYQKSLKNLW